MRRFLTLVMVTLGAAPASAALPSPGMLDELNVEVPGEPEVVELPGPRTLPIAGGHVRISAGRAAFHPNGQLAEGVLAARQPIGTELLPARTRVGFAPDGELAWLEAPVALHYFGVRFVARERIELGTTPAGVLDGDQVIGGLRLKSGTRASFELGIGPLRWEPTFVSGTLAEMQSVRGVQLPAGTELTVDRWAGSIWSAPLRARLARSWTLSGLKLAAGDEVAIDAAGGVTRAPAPSLDGLDLGAFGKTDAADGLRGPAGGLSP